MTEPKPLFTPGTIIELEDTTKLAEFEDAVALELNPNLNVYEWSGRMALKKLNSANEFQRKHQECDIDCRG